MIYFHIKKQRNANWSAIAPRSSQRHFIVSKEILPEQAGEEPRTIVFEAVYYRRTTRIERDEQRDGISWRKGLH